MYVCNIYLWSLFTNLQFQKLALNVYISIYIKHKVLIKTDLRLLNVERASVYLKVSVVKKM